jgi:LacI family transcriptional regulator
VVTSKDVAKLAGVSQATVSRVMSSSGQISPGTIERVHAAMDELGYVPHAGAQAMKTRRTKTIGVVVADITNPFYSEVLDELTKVLSAADYRVVLWNAGGNSHNDALRAIREHALDGVVFTTATAESPELQAAVEAKSPIVLINRTIDGVECDRVSSDNLAGGAAVAEYLIGNGKKRIAFIGGSSTASTSRDRARGFLKRMERLGHPIPGAMRREAGFSHDLSVSAMADLLLNDLERPDAVFCANDYMAFGALDALRLAGLTAPTDCWVVGYDDVEPSSWPSINLTTVRQPSRLMARAGAQMLLNRIRNPGQPWQRQDFPCELMVRGSTADSAMPDSKPSSI